MTDRFKGFRQEVVDVAGVKIHVWIAGQGEPLLLLHGYPQTHLMWHRVAPTLAKEYTVVVPDLRGYGDSDCPDTIDGHLAYSKRIVAEEQVEMMSRLGFETFFLMGHDRGARVSHQMAVDWPDRVRRLVLLDIISTRDMYDQMNFESSQAYYHWFFLCQPSPLPEMLIGGSPEAFVRSFLSNLSERQGVFPEDVVAEYVEKFSRPDVIRATCEDYRAGATVDLVHQAEQGARLKVPTLVLWGAPGLKKLDVLALWRSRGDSVSGISLDGVGHYIPEEAPDATVAAARIFFGSSERELDDTQLKQIAAAS